MESEDTKQNLAELKKDEQICRDFQRGVCSRGDKCKFAHPSGMGSEPKDQPMICRDFQNGTCNRSTCKYLHVTNQEEKDFLRSGQLPNHVRGGGGGGGGAGGGGGGAGGGGGRGWEATLPVCKDFLNNKCNRGSNCKFRHVLEEGMYGGGYYDEPPRKRPRDSMDSDYRYLMEENVSLRRKVSELQKDVADLRATNDILLEQNARYRRSGGASAASYGGGYGTDAYNSVASSVAYPSRDSYTAAGAYNSYGSAKPAGAVGYDGYTKFE